jgi:hypothetical protein
VEIINAKSLGRNGDLIKKAEAGRQGRPTFFVGLTGSAPGYFLQQLFFFVAPLFLDNTYNRGISKETNQARKKVSIFMLLAS